MDRFACAQCTACPFTVATLPGEALPHEIHVTVAAGYVTAFTQACAELGVKPILLALERSNGASLHDLMTSSTIFGPSHAALAEVERITTGLQERGFHVLRQKIESAPWHPWAPTNANEQLMKEGQYFETHLAVRLFDVDYPDLLAVTSVIDAHVSRNVFKAGDADGRVVRMVTLRSSTGTYEDFVVRQTAALTSLQRRWVVERTITEFTWYDSHQRHDATWMTPVYMSIPS